MTTKQWAIIKEKLVCKITSSWLWKGRNLAVFSHRESRGVRGVGKKIFLWVPERSSFSLPRQSSWQHYYTSSCLSSAALFLCRNICDLDSVKKHSLCFVLHLHQSQILILLSFYWLICLSTLREVYREQKNHRNTKWLLRARLEQWFHGALYRRSLLLCIAIVLWKVIAFLVMITQNELNMHLFVIHENRYLFIKLNREQGVTECLAKLWQPPLPAHSRHTETWSKEMWYLNQF